MKYNSKVTVDIKGLKRLYVETYDDINEAYPHSYKFIFFIVANICINYALQCMYYVFGENTQFVIIPLFQVILMSFVASFSTVMILNLIYAYSATVRKKRG